ncbi:MAG: peptidase U62 [Candidatus Cloacimonetes bacterium 4572_55]|nr:MAG: peptidase U62 [Candidatus Cloacimonetes bacterium 4572_55]
MATKITRREFLDQGSKGILLAATVPYFLQSNVSSAFAASSMGLQDYYDHFIVDESILKGIMSEALAYGGDYCDVFFQHKINNYIGLQDKAVNRAYSNVDFGVGIRVLKGVQTGYSFTEEITPKAMKLAAKTAATIANSSKQVDPVQFKLHTHPNYYPIETPWEDVPIDRKIPYLQEINEKVFAADKRIVKSNIWFSNETSYILFANSEGRLTYDYQPMGAISVNCTAEQDGKRESNGYTISGRNGIEFLTPKSIDRVVKEATRKTVDLFKAIKPEGGEMEVVLAAGSSGILLHEAIGHGMEADANRKEESIFSDKIGKPVAEKFVTIVDDGRDSNARGSINIDDEGNDTERTMLVEDGILRSYMHDRLSSRHYNLKPTGNGRRQSFRFSPLPRMRNTYMLPGPHTKEEIIGSVKKGLYAEYFTNGEVRIGPGDFTFYVKSGMLIEDGKLTSPVKDINIIGNGPQVLEDIVMVGDDLKISESGWNCGKGGQFVPVSMGLPTVKVSKITVGGVS